MTTISETEAARLLADLRNRYAVAPYDPAHDLTLRQIMDALQLTEAQARSLVAAEVAAERLTVRKVVVGNARTCVYRRNH